MAAYLKQCAREQISNVRSSFMTEKLPSNTDRLVAHSVGLSQAHRQLLIHTAGPGFTEITGQLADWLQEIGAVQGLLTIFVAHTSASLTIQENADPDVRRDLADALRRFAPESSDYRHSSEGPDDMPAHIKAMLTSVSLSIPVLDGRTALGTWQGVYLIEHRTRQHNRKLELHFVGTRQNSAF